MYVFKKLQHFVLDRFFMPLSFLRQKPTLEVSFGAPSATNIQKDPCRRKNNKIIAAWTSKRAWKGISPFRQFVSHRFEICIRPTPHPETVSTRTITFLFGNSYKPLFVIVTWVGVDPKYTYEKTKTR